MNGRFYSVVRLVLVAHLTGVFPIAAVAATADRSKLPEIDSLINNGRFQQAKLELQTLIVSHPRDASYHLRLARLMQVTGENELSVREYEAALALEPHLVEALVGLSKVSAQNLDIEASLKYAKAALDIDSTSAQARLAYTAALMQGDRMSEADRELDYLLASDASNPETLMLAYRLKSKKGEMAEARGYLEEALARDPSRVDRKLELADVLERDGEFEKARANLESILKSNPYNMDARLKLARNLEFFYQDYDGAIGNYRQALTQDSNSPAAHTGLERCQAKKNNLALRLKYAVRKFVDDTFKSWNKRS